MSKVNKKEQDAKKEEELKKVKPFFTKRKVLQVFESVNAQVKLFVETSSVEKAPIVYGFPNIGITPVITCSYLVDDLDLPLIGCIDVEKMPSNAVVSHTGQPCYSIRIFGDKRIIVICSELKIPDEVLSDLSKSIVAFAKGIKSQMVWSVEGVPVEKVDKIEREEMQYVTSNEELAKKLVENGHKPLHDAVVAGVTGAVLSEIAVFGDDLDVCAVLAPTSSFYPDVWASVMFIRLINTVYDTFSSDTSKLEQSATGLEDKVKQLMSNTLRRSGNNAGGYSNMYR